MKLIILSPTKKIIYEDVKMLHLESEAGEIEILPGHEKFVSALNIGVAKIKTNDKVEVLAINGGVIKVENDVLEIITSEAMLTQDIVKKDIEKALVAAQQKMSTTILPTELIRIEKEIKYQKLKQKMSKY